MDKPVILTGFMGSGKSTVARKLSYMIRTPLIDTDAYLENKEKKSISDIFAGSGEAHFRELETKYLNEILDKKEDHIISTGGGLPVNKVNRDIIQGKKKNGLVVYLKAKPETIYERVKDNDDRPLLRCDDPMERIRTLLNERKEAYEDVADLIIDTDEKSVGEIAKEIADRL